MRTLTLVLAAALFTAAPLAAQTTALVTGTTRTTVRITAGLTIPAYLQATETAELTETWKGTGFTEYLATYTVRANTRWDLVTTLPAGVTVLDEQGNWTAGDATIGNGTATNGDAVIVRVRVTDAAAETWRQMLEFRAVRGF